MRGMGGGMGNLLKQAQKVQRDMAKAQEELADIEVSASSGGGMVNVKANAKQEILSIEIKPDAVDPEDVEMLEDLVLAAVNEALRLGADASEKHMEKVAGPLKGMMPPGMKIPGF